jgi:hypothetical protein
MAPVTPAQPAGPLEPAGQLQWTVQLTFWAVVLPARQSVQTKSAIA